MALQFYGNFQKMFKQIENFNYEINEQGEVRNTKFNRFLKPFNNGNGYLCVDLFHNGESNVRSIHRLIMQYFGPEQTAEEVNHKDGNKLNNTLNNLEWITKADNQRHRYFQLNKSASRCELTGRFMST